MAWVDRLGAFADGSSGLIMMGQRRRYNTQTVHKIKMLVNSLEIFITASTRHKVSLLVREESTLEKGRLFSYPLIALSHFPEPCLCIYVNAVILVLEERCLCDHDCLPTPQTPSSYAPRIIAQNNKDAFLVFYRRLL